ncbi:hypothetical protein M378DRAFT_199825 [Amanita muscaria Koide BX008]|uniref:Uncharacterized protein n=1 Tax=Amanita muscaria (strain Koide BX008) TaxID=946122 RepID=A0A0C2SBT0_AMAMK|nr:hypothetical protein M378DRAFT_199825 [Amanita muscaria Koide BX008]
MGVGEIFALEACLLAHREQEISAEIDAGLEVNDYFGFYRAEDLRRPPDEGGTGDGEGLDEDDIMDEGFPDIEAEDQQSDLGEVEEDTDSEDEDEGIPHSFYLDVVIEDASAPVGESGSSAESTVAYYVKHFPGLAGQPLNMPNSSDSDPYVNGQPAVLNILIESAPRIRTDGDKVAHEVSIDRTRYNSAIGRCKSSTDRQALNLFLDLVMTYKW